MRQQILRAEARIQQAWEGLLNAGREALSKESMPGFKWRDIAYDDAIQEATTARISSSILRIYAPTGIPPSVVGQPKPPRVLRRLLDVVCRRQGFPTWTRLSPRGRGFDVAVA
ncbi:hypothetical protein PG997_011580 [Apiospora hydei]|uniref:Uncharacterized protein n=1 Tax=Apiospora hydei TaxID=1337664 RepID=A0ABR1VKF7_9PEZI